MCWVAFDRAVAMAEALGLDGPIDRWRCASATRSTPRCANARYNAELGAFTQTYDGASSTRRCS